LQALFFIPKFVFNLNQTMTKLFRKIFGSADPILKEALKSGAFLVDVRTKTEFDAGSAKNAVNIPLSDLMEELEQFNNKQQIVVFCHSGVRSCYARQLLMENGFQSVINGGGLQKVLNAIKENG
jgi:rhodanese-related sulfurtransferase